MILGIFLFFFCQWHRQTMTAKTTGEQPKHAPDRWTFGVEEGGGGLVLQDTDLISKTPPLLLGRLDICSLGVGIAFIARLRRGTPHSPLSHTHCNLRGRERDGDRERGGGRRGQRREEERHGAKDPQAKNHGRSRKWRSGGRKERVARKRDEKEKQKRGEKRNMNNHT